MSGPEPGQYLIQLNQDGAPSKPVGIDGGAASVVVSGRNNVFTVKKSEDGTYTLVLELDEAQYIKTDGENENVVGDINPPPSAWNIFEGEGGGSVISRAPGLIGVALCWAVEDVRPGQHVIIKGFPVIPNVKLPEWKFLRWTDTE